MSHQVFVDKMFSVLCTPMVFLAESSFVIARSKGHPSDGPFFVMFWSRKHIQLGNSAPMSFRHLRSGPSTVSCVLLRRTCLRRTPPHYSRSAHQCAGRAVYFAAAKYGKAGRPPGVATLVAVRGLVPSGCIAGSRRASVIISQPEKHL